MTLPLLVLAVMATVAPAQEHVLLGRWIPVGEPADDPLTIWEFEVNGVVTMTLRALPGAGGTYRFDGRALTYRFDDGSGSTVEVSLADDTMVQRSSHGDLRLRRVGPVVNKAHPLHGTWDVESPNLLTNRYVYHPDGTFVLQSLERGTYTLAADTVIVSMPDPPVPTLRFHIRARGRDSELVGLDTSANFHPPTLRRAR
jgi:hypothetical protein